MKRWIAAILSLYGCSWAFSTPGQPTINSQPHLKGHLKSVYGKLGVNDRIQAAITALQHGILHLE